MTSITKRIVGLTSISRFYVSTAILTLGYVPLNCCYTVYNISRQGFDYDISTI